MRIKELREKRAKLAADAQAILTKADQMSPEDETRFDEIMAEVDKLAKQIEREERAAALASEMNQPANERRSGREDRVPGNDDGNSDERASRYGQAFRNWMRYGGEITAEERSILRSGFQSAEELRAQGVASGAAGGYTVPEDFMSQLEQAMLAYGGMLTAADVIRTGTGAALPWPTVNDTSNEGALLAENTQDSEQDVTFAQKQLDAYKYTSKIVRVSVELLQDSVFNMDSFLTGAFGERLGRILNRHTTVGTGSSQPNGIVTASTAGVTLASSSAVTFDELIDLEHSVDPAYRPGARWMFNDSTLKVIKKLKDSENRPLWLAGYREGEPDTILRYPFAINQHMASMEASAKSILFGDLKKYKIRIVRDMTMVRLVERYADYHQVGFIAFMRADGELIDAGTNPVKHAVHPSP